MVPQPKETFMNLTRISHVMLAAYGVVAFAAAADAATVWALESTGQVMKIDSATRRAMPGFAVKGADSALMSLAVRPTDGKLYGLTAMGSLVSIDPATGMATMLPKLDKKLEVGPRAAIKFNPVVDRLRVVGASGNNYRINVDTGAVMVDGALKYAPGTPLSGTAPMVTAAAYSNAMAGAKETTLYTIDPMLAQMNTQVPPNDGVQMVKGPLGVKPDNGIGFDILSDGAGGNQGFVVTGGALHMINLADGKITTAGPVASLKGKEVVAAAVTK
jgi:hypothetical protein